MAHDGSVTSGKYNTGTGSLCGKGGGESEIAGLHGVVRCKGNRPRNHVTLADENDEGRKPT